jgi:hypothetical protein
MAYVSTVASSTPVQEIVTKERTLQIRLRQATWESLYGM